MVSLFTRRTVERAPSRAIAYLNSRITELAEMGMLTLLDKLEHADGEELLGRLNDLWCLFWRHLRSYFLAVFLPFTTEPSLVSAASQSGHASHRALVDVERLLCLAFRDQVVLPLCDRLGPMLVREAFQTGAASRRSSGVLNRASRTSSGLSLYGKHAVDSQRHSRQGSTGAWHRAQSSGHADQALRMQMVSVLAMLRTNDGAQGRLDELGLAMRGVGALQLHPADEKALHMKRESSGTQRDEGAATQAPSQATIHRQRWSWQHSEQSDEDEEDDDDEDEEEDTSGPSQRLTSRQSSFTTSDTMSSNEMRREVRR